MVRKFIAYLLTWACGCVTGIFCKNDYMAKKIVANKEMSEKHLSLFLLMNDWVLIKQEGKDLQDFLTEKGYKKIAVYGMSYAGKAFVNELKNSEITVAAAVDRALAGSFQGIPIYSSPKELPEVDAVVVTAVNAFGQIEEELHKQVQCDVISLREIIDDIITHVGGKN